MSMDEDKLLRFMLAVMAVTVVVWCVAATVVMFKAIGCM